MSFSIRPRPHKPLCASHSLKHTDWEGERDLTSDSEATPCTDTHLTIQTWKNGQQRKHLTVWKQARWWCLHREVNVCSKQMATNRKNSHDSSLIYMFNSCYKLIWTVRWDEINGQLMSPLTKQWTRQMRLSLSRPPPLPLKPSNISYKKKKTPVTPIPPPPPFLFPTTAPLAAPGFCCTNQEQMSAGAVLKDPAVLDASHMLFIQRWRLTARLLVKPISKKKRKRGGKKTNSPNAFKSLQKQNIYEHTFFLLSTIYCSFCGCFPPICGLWPSKSKKSQEAVVKNISCKYLLKYMKTSGAVQSTENKKMTSVLN